MKVTVYAIAKNEEKFAARWARSMAEADEVVVLDTGSEDDTVRILKENGVKTAAARVEPWRFDVARNRSLRLVPADTDICVCTDLDEIFEPGWREKVEIAWKPGTQCLKYKYVWSHTDGGEGVVFYIEKIHAYGCFRWVNPVHEVLEYTGGEPYRAEVCAAVLHHYPDDEKSRAAYLPLLELAVAEQPDNDRNTHYLGREYLYRGRYREAIAMLKRHLALPRAVWADERCASMRFIAKSHLALGEASEAERWLLRAVAEAPGLREPCVDLAALYYERGAWKDTIYFAERALRITERSMSYINEPLSWGGYPYDILSIAYYRSCNAEKAAEAAEKALSFTPDDARIQGNLALFRK